MFGKSIGFSVECGRTINGSGQVYALMRQTPGRHYNTSDLIAYSDNLPLSTLVELNLDGDNVLATIKAKSQEQAISKFNRFVKRMRRSLKGINKYGMGL